MFLLEKNNNLYLVSCSSVDNIWDKQYRDGKDVLFVCLCVWLFIISVCGRPAQLFVDQWQGKNITVEGIVGTTYLWQLGNWKTEMDMTKSISPLSYFLNKAPILLVPASFQMYHHSFNWWEKWPHWWIWDVILKAHFKSFWTLQC